MFYPRVARRYGDGAGEEYSAALPAQAAMPMRREVPL